MENNDILNVEINGKPHQLVMTFGLLNEVLSIVGTLENVTAIALEPNTRKEILKAILVDRDENGNPKEFSFSDTNMSTEDTLKILSWAMSHAMDFFMATVKLIQNLEGKYEGVLKDLTETTKGRQSSSTGRRR